MSKVRREKHKDLVFNERIYKLIIRAIKPDIKSPRWRQLGKSENERIF